MALRVAAGQGKLPPHAAEYAASFWRITHGPLPTSATFGDKRFYDVLQAIYSACDRFFNQHQHYNGTFLLAHIFLNPPDSTPLYCADPPPPPRTSIPRHPLTQSRRATCASV